ncbi:MAG: hypothetical protein MRY79_04500 [Alphaproteobacteria bacterium]|nr:hypothetical protein [Alphaproteobacteria bacterium]
MIQALWFLCQLAALIGSAIWLLNRPGHISIEWLDYTITLQSGVLFLILAIGILCILGIYQLAAHIFTLPQIINRHQDKKRHQRGLMAITHTLGALAAGNGKLATRYAEQTRQFLPKGHGLPLLLEAQSAYLNGKTGLAQNKFESLLEHKDTSFLGLRGLLKIAMDQQNYTLALHHAREALNSNKSNSKQIWLVYTIYRLEIKNRLWGDALTTAHRLLKLPEVKKDPDLIQKLKSDMIAIHLMQHDTHLKEGDEKSALHALKTACKINTSFIPTITRLCRSYLNQDQKKKAVRLIKKTWGLNPHPELAAYWQKLGPQPNKGSLKNREEKMTKWMRTLITLNEDSVESYVACAEKAIELGLWHPAREFLKTAQKLEPPRARLFRLLAIIEQNSSLNDHGLQDIMAQAGEALPDKVWTCQETGLIYQEWAPLAKPHDGFNTIIWGIPRTGTGTAANANRLQTAMPTLFFEPAA